MKIKGIFYGLVALFCTLPSHVFSQSAEAQQLLLNVEKLSQLKNILNDMKKGYVVISNGYNAVKNLSQGNFSLHETFIDGLMLISPEVRKYPRVADILSAQKDIVSEAKRALKSFNASDLLNPTELDYLRKVYAGLFSHSMSNLNELTMVLTANSLRMNDEERLKAIDRIFENTTEQVSFLRSFNEQTSRLLLQRKAAKADVEGIQRLFNTK